MHKGNLILTNKTRRRVVKSMQVLLEEHSKAYFNFIDSLHSEATKEKYKFCLEKFLNHYRIDLLSFLKLPQQDMTNLIIKYLVSDCLGYVSLHAKQQGQTFARLDYK